MQTSQTAGVWRLGGEGFQQRLEDAERNNKQQEPGSQTVHWGSKHNAGIWESATGCEPIRSLFRATRRYKGLFKFLSVSGFVQNFETRIVATRSFISRAV